MKEKTVSEAIHFRRSVRIFDPEQSIKSMVVKKNLEHAQNGNDDSRLRWMPIRTTVNYN